MLRLWSGSCLTTLGTQEQCNGGQVIRTLDLLMCMKLLPDNPVFLYSIELPTECNILLFVDVCRTKCQKMFQDRP